MPNKKVTALQKTHTPAHGSYGKHVLQEWTVVARKDYYTRASRECANKYFAAAMSLQDSLHSCSASARTQFAFEISTKNMR
jgi:hypothetical protein